MGVKISRVNGMAPGHISKVRRLGNGATYEVYATTTSGKRYNLGVWRRGAVWPVGTAGYIWVDHVDGFHEFTTMKQLQQSKLNAY